MAMHDKALAFPPLAGLLVLTACQIDAYSASRVEPFEVSADGVRSVACSTHNGSIAMHGTSATVVRGQAELTARASTPSAAQELLALMELTHTLDGGVLTLGWRWRDGGGFNRSADASFTGDVPVGMSVALESHNGDVVATGVGGLSKFTSHNGTVAVEGTFDNVTAETHNGAIHARLRGSGAVDGRLETHNGEVEVDLGQRSAHVVADTNNGSISCLRAASVRAERDSYLEAMIGESAGELRVTTHNGGIQIR